MYPIVEVTKKLLRGGTVMADCGTKLYTPDGFGFYKALWGRDFAYILSAAGEFIPAEEMKAAIEFLMAGARADGWIPDRVEPDGVARYTAGGEHFPASPNLDTGPFLVIAADVYLRRLEEDKARQQFEAWQEVLQRSLDCLPVDDMGLVWNHADPPHSPYGFMDCIVKTGKLAMETLLQWQALKIMAEWGGRLRPGYDGAERKTAVHRIGICIYLYRGKRHAAGLHRLLQPDRCVGSLLRAAHWIPPGGKTEGSDFYMAH